jgi:hypothetical protein
MIPLTLKFSHLLPVAQSHKNRERKQIRTSPSLSVITATNTRSHNVRITDIKLSRAVPFAVGALIATNIAAIGFAELQISTLAKSSQELAAFTRQNDGSIKELEVLAKGIELDIVSTQEALSDVSATRAWTVWMTASPWQTNRPPLWLKRPIA